MGPAEVGVTLGGLALSAFVAWFFWFSPKGATRVSAVGGVQEVDIVVKGGYTPDVIVVQAGKPVRLNFNRQESAACSETVIFGDFGKSARLPEGQVVPVELLPEQPGYISLTGILWASGQRLQHLHRHRITVHNHSEMAYLHHRYAILYLSVSRYRRCKLDTAAITVSADPEKSLILRGIF